MDAFLAHLIQDGSNGLHPESRTCGCPSCQEALFAEVRCSSCKFALPSVAHAQLPQEQYPFLSSSSPERHSAHTTIATMKTLIQTGRAAIEDLTATVDALESYVYYETWRIAPIRALPVELLQLVFCFFPDSTRLAREQHLPVLALTQVNRQWREIAVATRCLWSDIHLAFARSTEIGPTSDLDVEYASSYLTCLELCLRRSRGAPLVITVSRPWLWDSSAPGGVTEGKLLDCVALEAPRIQVLEMPNSSLDDFRRRLLPDKPLSQLVEFRVQGWGPSDLCLLADSHPQQVFIEPCHHPSPAFLTPLTFSFVTEYEGEGSFFELRAGQASLQRLDLTFAAEWAEQPSPAPLVFSALQSLTVAHRLLDEADAPDDLFLNVSAPGLEELMFDDGDWILEDEARRFVEEATKLQKLVVGRKCMMEREHMQGLLECLPQLTELHLYSGAELLEDDAEGGGILSSLTNLTLCPLLTDFYLTEEMRAVVCRIERQRKPWVK